MNSYTARQPVYWALHRQCSLAFSKLLTTFAVCALPLLTCAQVTQAWVARYNGPANSEDTPIALALDSAGNIYVTGFSSNGANWDYATAKYAPNGDLLWAQRYDSGGSEFCRGFAVDSAGNAYVTGDGGTVKYDANGNQLWAVKYYSNGSDPFMALAVDSAGSVYVTGYFWNTSNSNHDFVTVKYDANGNQVWVKTYDSSGYDLANDITTDSAGNIYVTGVAFFSSANVYAFATVKYDSDGNQVWSLLRLGATGFISTFPSIVVDSAGNICVAGNGTTGIVTQKYSSNGAPLWVTSYNGTASGIAVDGVGNVYVAGYAYNGSNNDFVTVKYDADGDQVWVKTYDNGSDDIGQDLTVDSAGNVYVTGWSSNGANADFATVKYDANGNQVWVKRYDNGGGDLGGGRGAIAVDNAGNIYVTGKSSNGSNDDYATVKYAPLVGDVNRDGCVDDADLLRVLFAFGNTGTNLAEDLNRDNIVDDADLLLVLFNFGAGCQ